MRQSSHATYDHVFDAYYMLRSKKQQFISKKELVLITAHHYERCIMYLNHGSIALWQLACLYA